MTVSVGEEGEGLTYDKLKRCADLLNAANVPTAGRMWFPPWPVVIVWRHMTTVERLLADGCGNVEPCAFDKRMVRGRLMNLAAVPHHPPDRRPCKRRQLATKRKRDEVLC